MKTIGQCFYAFSTGAKALVLVLVLVTSSTVAFPQSFDIETFRQIDPDELQKAEARMDEYIEPGTARLLRQPRNAAERYVVARQTRLAEEFAVQPQWQQLPDGTQAMESFWPAARATRVRVDEQGRIHVQCVSAAERLGGTLPDFRRPESAPVASIKR